MGKKNNNFKFNSLDFIGYIWSIRKFLLIIGITAFIISGIVSFLITPKFKSTVIMFPVTSSSISRPLLTNDSYPQDDLLKIGTEEDGEQLMQILHSSAVREKVAERVDLVKHYHINTNDVNWKTSLSRMFAENVKFKRTEYTSIVIEVLDRDPKMAAKIANEISNQVDSVMNEIQQQRANKAFEIVKKECEELETNVTLLQDSLKTITKSGLVGFGDDKRVYHNAYAKALGKGNIYGANELSKKLKIINEKEGIFYLLTIEVTDKINILVSMREKYRQAKVNAEQKLPHKFVVDTAYPADIKATPNRSVLVLVSTISAMFFALVLMLIKDTIINRLKD